MDKIELTPKQHKELMIEYACQQFEAFLTIKGYLSCGAEYMALRSLVNVMGLNKRELNYIVKNKRVEGLTNKQIKDIREILNA